MREPFFFTRRGIPLLVGMAALLLLGSCKNRQWSERWEESLEKTQPSVMIMDTLGIRWGMTIAEIGAGNGRMAVKMARRVGSSGHVYANDIDPAALAFMKERCRYNSIRNVSVVQGDEENPRFLAEKMDLIYIVNTYEYLTRPVQVLRAALPALKKEGVLVIIAADPAKIGRENVMAAPREQVIFEAEEAGYMVFRISDFLEKDTIYFLKARK